MTDFDSYYYNHCCGQPYERNELWLTFFGGIADRVVEDIHPATVLDAGCAMGFLVEGLRKREVEAYGIDISEYAIQNVHEDIRPYCRVGSITDAFPIRYDLIVSIEVLEHMSKEEAEVAIQNFCAHTDDILFSSTPFDYKEITHYNVQPPEYWAEQFARHGFLRDVDFDASFITPWAVRFRRSREPLHRVVREYERRFALLLKEATDLRALNLEMRSQISSSEELIQSLHRQIDGLQGELSETRNSRSWRLITRLQQVRLKIIPSDSRREKVLNRFLHLFFE